jgi:hypothetical protein
MLRFTYFACFFSPTHACLRNGLLPSGFLFPPLCVGCLISLDLIMLEGSPKYESLNMQSSPPSSYLIFLRCTYSSHHPVLTYPHFASNRHVPHRSGHQQSQHQLVMGNDGEGVLTCFRFWTVSFTAAEMKSVLATVC